jgi:hypothetical protein
VLERGEALAAVLEDRDRAARVGLGRRAVEIDVAPVDPEEQPQRRVAERSRERVSHALRGRELGELDHQARHRAAPQPGAEQAGEEGQRDDALDLSGF